MYDSICFKINIQLGAIHSELFFLNNPLRNTLNISYIDKIRYSWIHNKSTLTWDTKLSIGTIEGFPHNDSTGQGKQVLQAYNYNLVLILSQFFWCLFVCVCLHVLLFNFFNKLTLSKPTYFCLNVIFTGCQYIYHCLVFPMLYMSNCQKVLFNMLLTFTSYYCYFSVS